MGRNDEVSMRDSDSYAADEAAAAEAAAEAERIAREAKD